MPMSANRIEVASDHVGDGFEDGPDHVRGTVVEAESGDCRSGVRIGIGSHCPLEMGDDHHSFGPGRYIRRCIQQLS